MLFRHDGKAGDNIFRSDPALPFQQIRTEHFETTNGIPHPFSERLDKPDAYARMFDNIKFLKSKHKEGRGPMCMYVGYHTPLYIHIPPPTIQHPASNT